MKNTTYTPKVTVIIPAYNAEKYLDRCLDSFAGQTLSDIEVIVVDDGSTDATGRLADVFAQKDSRFQVIHQENKGVAAARQAGLDHASGEYVIHADSDDWVDPEMLAELVAVAENNDSDMVICDVSIIHPGGFVEYRLGKPDPIDPVSVFGQMFFDLYSSLCNKLIRYSCIRDNGVNFMEGVNISEDRLFLLRLLSCCNIRVSYVNKAFYHYDHTQNEQSLCNKGLLALDILKPFGIVKNHCDIRPVQDYFDKAVFHFAHQYLYEPKALCPDYSSVFRPYSSNILRASGFPVRDKVFIFLKLHHINLPLSKIKCIWNKLKSSLVNRKNL